MSRCNNKSRGITNFRQSVACICTHSHHTRWPRTSNLIPPVATERWMERAAAAIHLCSEIAYFPSSHIAASRNTGISVVTGKRFTAAHSDSDLSALNAVTFLNGT